MTAAVATTEHARRAKSARPALRVLVRPAPQREPPFDDELVAAPVLTPYDQRLPFEKAPAPVTRLTPPIRSSGLPDPATWGRRLLIGLIETADGRRPLHQLASLLSMSVTRGLGADFERASHAGTPHWLHRGTVRSMRSAEPAEGVAELCATVETGRRVRAVAMRLEEQHGRWRCVRLQLG
ncbi:MAG: hypothetical protein QOF92_3237 [Pseudonocardiales bacterium]|jgi:hypothetical protein|nr:hypothetical protein [Pseudonocardiales bacterium]